MRDRKPQQVLVHVDLVVRDIEESLRFYQDCLGCDVVEDSRIDGAPAAFYTGGAAQSMRVVLLSVSGDEPILGAMLELMAFTPPAKRHEVTSGASTGIRNLTIAVRDADFDDILEHLAFKRVARASDVMDIDLPRLGRSRIVFIRDPDGNLIELVAQRPVQRSAP